MLLKRLNIELFVVALGVVTVLIFLYSFLLSSSSLDDQLDLMQRASEIRFRLPVAHLWFEEAIAGDSTVDLEREVFQNIDDAIADCDLFLQGGEERGRRIEAVPAGELRRGIDSLRGMIVAWRSLTETRWENRETARPGTRVDSLYDLAFQRMLGRIESNDRIIEDGIALARQKILFTDAVILVLLVLLFTAMTYFAYRSRRLVVTERDFAETLINSLPGIFFLITQDETFVRWNRRFENVTGYSATEIAALKTSDFVAEEDRPAVAEQVRRVFAMESSDIHVAIRGKDGRMMSYYLTGLPLEVGGMKLLIGMGIDISSQLEIERQLKDREEYFRSLLEQSTDIILILDEQGVITYASPSSERVMGYKPEELVGTNSFGHLHPEDARRISEVFRDHMSEPGSVKYQEYRFRTKEGGWKIMEGSGSNLLAHPVVRGIVINARDITERKELQDQYLRAQRLEGIGSLASGIAHDLNNILGPILLSSEILRMKISDPSVTRVLSTIESNAQRGSGMVKQVLTFARGMAGAHGLLQPRHLVSEIVDMARQTFSKSIVIEKSAPKDLSLVKGDATQIHQVLLNLFVNARDAMPKGGRLSVTATDVEITAGDPRVKRGADVGKYVRITVADTGTGISPGLLPRIFDPFFTTKEEGKGTGLGLSTVSTIVKEHRGVIDVESSSGGTSFHVYLPAAAGEEAEKKEIEELPTGNGELLLVVDDEESSRDLMGTILKAYGYDAVTAPDGIEAVTLFVQRKDDIRLVLTDLEMPFLDGQGVIRAIRRVQPGVKVLVVTGSEMRAQAESLQSESDGILIKPFSAASLVRMVHAVLEERRQGAEES